MSKIFIVIYWITIFVTINIKFLKIFFSFNNLIKKIKIIKINNIKENLKVENQLLL